MASGWANGDVQWQERRNREWIARYLLGLPFPDKDDAGVLKVTPRAVSVAVTTIETVFVTFPSAPLVIVHRLTLTSTVDVERWAYVAHGGIGIVFSKSIQPRETISFEGPWLCSGAQSLSAAANAAGVAVRADYTVCLGATPGITAVGGRANLSATPAALYTAPGDVHAAYVASLSYGTVNLAAADFATSVVLELLPAGQGTAAQFQIATAPMASFETEIIGGYTLQPGDAVRAWKVGPDPAVVGVNVVEFRG
jgi:hypothetical protein